MALSAVELYERLKPRLGEDETKALIEYVDGKIRGENEIAALGRGRV
jgi:hypothetical protein